MAVNQELSNPKLSMLLNSSKLGENQATNSHLTKQEQMLLNSSKLVGNQATNNHLTKQANSTQTQITSKTLDQIKSPPQ
jgi:hypothetical protein